MSDLKAILVATVIGLAGILYAVHLNDRDGVQVIEHYTPAPAIVGDAAFVPGTPDPDAPLIGDTASG